MRRFLATAWLVIADILIINIAYVFAFVLKFEFDVESAQFDAWFVVYVDNILPITLLSLLLPAVLGSYSAIWRYASSRELVKLVLGIWLGTLATAEYIDLTGQMMPTSVYIVSALISTLLLPGLRAGIKLFRRLQARSRRSKAVDGVDSGRAPAGSAPETGGAGSGGSVDSDSADIPGPRRVIVVGADETGAHVIRALREHKEYGRRVAAFVDDDSAKIGRRIDGVRVAGSLAQLPDIVQRFGADEIIMGHDYTSGKDLENIADICAQTGCGIQILPSFGEMLHARKPMRHIGREAVERLLCGAGPGAFASEADAEKAAALASFLGKSDEKELRSFISGRVVLVTGAGGRIGRELCRQIARLVPRRLILLDVSEAGVCELAAQLAAEYPRLELETVIGSTCDRQYMEHVTARYVPHIIFHLAASSAYDNGGFPTAPSGELAKRNALSARNMAELAEKYAAQRFVLIESGLACAPQSETASADTAKNTKYLTLRLGLVLSADSPLIKNFIRQIAAGGPLVLPAALANEIYCISAGQAAREILAASLRAEQADENGRIEDIDMGEPKRLADIARGIVRLAGYIPGADIEIV